MVVEIVGEKRIVVEFVGEERVGRKICRGEEGWS
jgi:hypothetical protein